MQDVGIVKEGARHRCVGLGQSLGRMCSKSLSMLTDRAVVY